MSPFGEAEHQVPPRRECERLEFDARLVPDLLHAGKVQVVDDGDVDERIRASVEAQNKRVMAHVGPVSVALLRGR